MFNDYFNNLFLADLALDFSKQEALAVTLYLVLDYYYSPGYKENKNKEVLGFLSCLLKEILNYNYSSIQNLVFGSDEGVLKEYLNLIDSNKNSKKVDRSGLSSKVLPDECFLANYNKQIELSQLIEEEFCVNNNSNDVLAKTIDNTDNNNNDILDNEASDLTLTPSLSSAESAGKSYKKMSINSSYTSFITQVISKYLHNNITNNNSTSNNNISTSNNNPNTFSSQNFKANNNKNQKINYSKEIYSNIPYYSNESIYTVLRFLHNIYERVVKLLSTYIKSQSEVVMEKKDGKYRLVQQEKISTSGDLMENYRKNTKLYDFIALFKMSIYKMIDNQNSFEDTCKDILGDDSYLLINLDKMILLVRFFC
jgi:hypothetical protein